MSYSSMFKTSLTPLMPWRQRHQTLSLSIPLKAHGTFYQLVNWHSEHPWLLTAQAIGKDANGLHRATRQVTDRRGGAHCLTFWGRGSRGSLAWVKSGVDSHAKGSNASVPQEWQSLTQVRLERDGRVFLSGPGVNVRAWDRPVSKAQGPTWLHFNSSPHPFLTHPFSLPPGLSGVSPERQQSKQMEGAHLFHWLTQLSWPRQVTNMQHMTQDAHASKTLSTETRPSTTKSQVFNGRTSYHGTATWGSEGHKQPNIQSQMCEWVPGTDEDRATQGESVKVPL